jgi:hypothetical protein
MTDSIEDSDVRRADQNIDPTALTQSEIEDSLPDDFSRQAKDAFADRISEQRDSVRESVDLSKRLVNNGQSTQLKGPDGGFGPSTDSVESTRLESNGEYYAELEDGSDFLIDRVDIDAGADSSREANW